MARLAAFLAIMALTAGSAFAGEFVKSERKRRMEKSGGTRRRS